MDKTQVVLLILILVYTNINTSFITFTCGMWWLLYLHECLLYLGELSIILTDRQTGINY